MKQRQGPNEDSGTTTLAFAIFLTPESLTCCDNQRRLWQTILRKRMKNHHISRYLMNSFCIVEVTFKLEKTKERRRERKREMESQRERKRESVKESDKGRERVRERESVLFCHSRQETGERQLWARVGLILAACVSAIRHGRERG